MQEKTSLGDADGFYLVDPVTGKSIPISGSKGVVITANTTAVTGVFTAIQILTDAVFSAFSETGATGVMTGISLPAGMTVFGLITGYTLTSGTIRAYKA